MIHSTDLRHACGAQNLVGTSEYGGYNLSPPGWNRVKVEAKTLWGLSLVGTSPHVPMPTGTPEYCFCN